VTDRPEIEVVVARTYLETNSRGAIVLDEQLSVAEHAVDEVGGSVVEHDEVDRTSQRTREVGRDIELEVVERGWRGRQQEADVDVACSFGCSACLAPA
jgi:hypothetical protein